MELYVHIPFCIKKCKYCDFLSFPADETVKKRYVEALCNEINYSGKALHKILIDKKQNLQEKCEGFWGENEQKAAKARKTGKIEVDTIYFGGGTPTALAADDLVQILQKIKEEFVVNDDAEITFECNPATIDKKGLQKLQKNGVNRLSIGLQSTFDDELELLGRIHNFDDFLRIFEDARAVGFKNLNVDLISALPGQTVEKYKTSIQRLIKLQPEHISSYSLILEEGTPFYELYNGCFEKLPDEETDREMYHLTKTMLQENGYERYEISNYAKPGFESKHNSGYWKRIPYLGLGLGASSLINNTRYRKKSDLALYLQIFGMQEKTCKFAKNEKMEIFPNELIEECETLDVVDRMAEFMYLGLRMCKGVSTTDFQREFNMDLWKVYGDVIEKLEKDGLLKVQKGNNGDRICLSDFGMDVSNYVFEKFI
ncbi:MAG: radical SAM family heme chaperone HemW [Lachnospiraceae bacterium]|nr:radical SAM family heme chaperone HemW [Lachnospiraceae bacterium]